MALAGCLQSSQLRVLTKMLFQHGQVPDCAIDILSIVCYVSSASCSLIITEAVQIIAAGGTGQAAQLAVLLHKCSQSASNAMGAGYPTKQSGTPEVLERT